MDERIFSLPLYLGLWACRPLTNRESAVIGCGACTLLQTVVSGSERVSRRVCSIFCIGGYIDELISCHIKCQLAGR